MIKYNKKLTFIMFFLLLFPIVSCAPEEKSAKKEQPAEVEQDITKRISWKDLQANTPAHINKKISDTYTIDADIHVPAAPKADVLFAKLKCLDEETAVSFFYKGKTPKREMDSTNQIVTYQNGSSSLGITEDYMYYKTKDANYLKLATEDFSSRWEVEGANATTYFDEVYTKENLDFMNREEAVMEVFRSLQKLWGDNVAEDPEVYALDYETLQKQQDKEIKEFQQMAEEYSSEDDVSEYYEIKKKFTQEDNCYLMYFTMIQNKIPVTKNSHDILGGERSLSGSVAEVKFSPKGIIDMHCRGIYQVESVAESPDTFISVEQALQKAYELKNAIISADIITIKSVDFEYVPSPCSKNYNEVKLVPTWTLTLDSARSISEKGEEHTTKRKGIVYINAVTGEELE